MAVRKVIVEEPATTQAQAQVDPSEFDPRFGAPSAPTKIEIAEPEAAGPNEAELRALYEAEKRRADELSKGADSTTRLTESFTKLAENLQSLATRPQAAPVQGPTESFEDFKARIEGNFIEKPFDAITQVVERYAGPAFNTMAGNFLKLAKQTARLTADEPEFFHKHEAEIDALVEQMPVQQRTDPDVYARAYDLIKVRHIDELADLRAARKAQGQGQGQTPGQAPAQTPAQTQAPVRAPTLGLAPEQSSLGAALSYGTPQAPRVQVEQANQIRITPAKAAAVRALMERQGIPENQFETVVELLHDNGEL